MEIDCLLDFKRKGKGIGGVCETGASRDPLGSYTPPWFSLPDTPSPTLSFLG